MDDIKPPTPDNNSQTDQDRPSASPVGMPSSGSGVIQGAADDDTPAFPIVPEQHDKTHKKDRRGANVTIAIVLAILVALVLIGVGYFVYQSESGSETSTTSEAPAETTKPTNTATETVKPATKETVDKGTTEVEGLVDKLDDTADFSESSVSDGNLGLE